MSLLTTHLPERRVLAWYLAQLRSGEFGEGDAEIGAALGNRAHLDVHPAAAAIPQQLQRHGAVDLDQPDAVAQIGRAPDRLAIDRQDDIAGPQSCTVGG